jgi:segregation and condensation protein B
MKNNSRNNDGIQINQTNYSMTELNQNTAEVSLEASLETLLFVAPGPVSLLQLAEALDMPQAKIEAALNDLTNAFRQGRGLRIQRHQGRYQLTTAPETAPLVEKFLGLEALARLSRAGLETLAIIAYRQPITRPGIDAIRGVNSDGVIKSLLSKGLIQEMGRAEGPGRPILYGITEDFLQHFGLDSLDELPPFELLEQEGVSPEEQRLLKD